MRVFESRARLGATCAAAALLCAVAAPATAETLSTSQSGPSGVSPELALALTARLDALERRNQELEAELDALRGQITADRNVLAKAAPKAVVSIPNGRPSFASPDGAFTAQLRGVFQMDLARFDQDSAGPLATDHRRGSFGSALEADRARDLADGANFRRARLGIEGRAFGDWRYNFLYDFGGAGVEDAGKINAAWLQYEGFGPAKLRVGAFAPPAGMDDVTSTNGSLFLERAAISDLVRGLAAADARNAAALFLDGERWTASAALTGGVVGQSTFDEQLGAVGRVAFTPFLGDSHLIHLGINSSVVIEPAATAPDVAPGAPTPVRLRERPEIKVDGTRLVDTGPMDAEGVTAWGLELAGQLRAVHLQSEYFSIAVDRRATGLSDPNFAGWYVQGAWTLTGEPRRYSASSGAFDPPRVDRPFSLGSGDWGVWELAARYSRLDLNYREGAPGTAPSPEAVRGGEQTGFTLGLNWYPNPAVRFQADVQRVEVDRLSPGGTAFGPAALTPPAGAQVGQELNIWSLRTQYAF